MVRRPLVVAVLLALAGRGDASLVEARPQRPVEVILHVDQTLPGANDSNAGTAAASLKSIGEALRRAIHNRRAGRSTRIVVHPGTYRESIALSGDGKEAEASIVLEGADERGVVISGSDVWTQWQRDGQSGLFRHPWPYEWRSPNLPEGWDQVRSQVESQPILLRSEMVFINAAPLEQVFSSAELRARVGTFFLEPAVAPRAGVLWVHAAEDVSRNDVLVEVSVRPALLVASGLNRLTLRRLVFQHASSQLQDAAVRIDRAANVLVDACRFERNSWIGLAVYESRDIAIKQVTASANGAGGVQAWRVRRLTVTDTEAAQNNWRGARGGFTGWATGQKFVSVHNARFVRYRGIGNQATGLWFDTDNTEISVVDSVICGNATRGVFLEASPGPFLIKDSRICDNGEIGIMATGAARVTIDGTTITGNREHQIVLPWLVDDHVETTAVDFETRRPVRIRSSAWTLTANTIGGAGDSSLVSVGRWPSFFDSFRSDRNRWQHAERRDVFRVYPRRGAPSDRLDFAGWMKASGQDRSSVFAYP
jgi:hypothetical protein